MIISTCGFGETGSSAVTDYLKECPEVQVNDNFEFTLATAVDGLEDLGHFIMEKNARQGASIYAIQRFERYIKSKIKNWTTQTAITKEEINKLTTDFLDAVTQLEYVGFSPRINRNDIGFIKKYVGDSLIRKRIVRKLERKGIIKQNFDFYPLDKVRVSIKPDNFYDAAQEYVSGLLREMGMDPDGMIALDQAFSGTDPAKSFQYFKDPYAIVVDRDPRDVYIFAKKKALSIDRFMPTDTVDNYIKYYRLMRDKQPYKNEHPRILSIRFEELIYEYDSTSKKIDDFLSIRNENKKTVFIPEMSIANTNLVTKYPEFAEDVKIIEKELPEYIFHFENYPDLQNTGKMFYGRSPKNPVKKITKQ